MAEKGRAQHSQKYTTLGETYEQVNREAEEARLKVETMEKTISDTLGRLVHNAGLTQAPFFLIHINHFCKNDDGVYYPAELALTAYTILHGIKEVLYTAVNPGPLACGYSFKAHMHTGDTHKMPLPPKAMGESDPAVIMRNIMKFVALHGDGHGDRMPPFYTLPKNMEYTESILAKWAVDCGFEKDIFRVFCLVNLFYGLKTAGLKPKGERLMLHGVEDAGLIFSSQAEKILVTDEYCYRPNISCQFHEESDNVVHCSRSCVTRWGYMMSDHLCANLDVKMIPGQHCPAGTVLRKAVIQTAGQSVTLYGNAETMKQAGYELGAAALDDSWTAVRQREKVSAEKNQGRAAPKESRSSGAAAAPLAMADQRRPTAMHWKAKLVVSYQPPLEAHGGSAPVNYGASVNVWKTPIPREGQLPANPSSVWDLPPSRQAAAKAMMAKDITPTTFQATVMDFPAMKIANQPGPSRQPPVGNKTESVEPADLTWVPLWHVAIEMERVQHDSSAKEPQQEAAAQPLGAKAIAPKDVEVDRTKGASPKESVNGAVRKNGEGQGRRGLNPNAAWFKPRKSADDASAGPEAKVARGRKNKQGRAC